MLTQAFAKLPALLRQGARGKDNMKAALLGGNLGENGQNYQFFPFYSKVSTSQVLRGLPALEPPKIGTKKARKLVIYIQIVNIHMSIYNIYIYIYILKLTTQDNV